VLSEYDMLVARARASACMRSARR